MYQGCARHSFFLRDGASQKQRSAGRGRGRAKLHKSILLQISDKRFLANGNSSKKMYLVLCQFCRDAVSSISKERGRAPLPAFYGHLFVSCSRWEGRCPVLRSSSKLVANDLHWQHTRETQITNGNIWSLPRWPAEQLPRKLILFSLFVLWAVFWDYDYGGRQILLCSRAPTRQIFVQIIWVKSE